MLASGGRVVKREQEDEDGAGVRAGAGVGPDEGAGSWRGARGGWAGLA
jgi:hypothetical protein